MTHDLPKRIRFDKQGNRPSSKFMTHLYYERSISERGGGVGPGLWSTPHYRPKRRVYHMRVYRGSDSSIRLEM